MKRRNWFFAKYIVCLCSSWKYNINQWSEFFKCLQQQIWNSKLFAWHFDGAFAEMETLFIKSRQLSIKWILNCKTLQDEFPRLIMHSLLVFIVQKKLSMLHISGMYRKWSQRNFWLTTRLSSFQFPIKTSVSYFCSILQPGWFHFASACSSILVLELMESN